MPLDWHGFQENQFWHAPNQCQYLERLARYNCCDSGRWGPVSQLNGGKSQAIVKLVPNGGTKSVSQMKRQADYLIRRTGEDPPHPGHPHRVDARAERNRFGIKLTREQLHELLEGWHAAYQGNRKHDKTSHFAISYPIGTDPAAAAAAGEDFAHEIFGSGNYGDTWQYYVVHHNQGEHEPTDEIPHPHERPHPHTHVVAFRVGRNGKRLKVSKRSDLNYDELRNVAVSTARKHGIDMEASPRFVRGEAERPPIQSELRRAMAENRKPYRPANSPQDAFEFAMSVYLRAKQLSMEADALREDMPQVAEVYQNVADHLRQGWPLSEIDVPFEIVNQQQIERVNEFLQGRRQLIMADFAELDQRIQNLPGDTEDQLKKRVATEREFSDLKVALAPFLSPAGEGDEDAHQHFMNTIVPDRRDPYRGVELDAGWNDKVGTRLVLDTYNDIADLAQQQGLNGRLMKRRYASGTSVNPALAEKWRNEEIAELHAAHPNANPEILDALHQNILERLVTADWQLYVHAKTKQEIVQDALENPGAALQPAPNDPRQQARVDRIRAVLTPQQIERLLPLDQYQQQLEEVTGQLANAGLGPFENGQAEPIEIRQLRVQKKDLQTQVDSRRAILTPITTHPEQQQQVLNIYRNACNSLGIPEVGEQQAHGAYPAQPENWPLSGKVGIWSDPEEPGQAAGGMGGPDEPGPGNPPQPPAPGDDHQHDPHHDHGPGGPGGPPPPAGSGMPNHHDADGDQDMSHDQLDPDEQVMHTDDDNDHTMQTAQEDPGVEAPAPLAVENQGAPNDEGNAPNPSSLLQTEIQHAGHDAHDMEEDQPDDDQNAASTGDNDQDMLAAQDGPGQQAPQSNMPTLQPAGDVTGQPSAQNVQASQGEQAGGSGGPEAPTNTEAEAPPSAPASRRRRITEVEKLRKWSFKPINPDNYGRTRSATRQLRAERAAIMARRAAEGVARLRQPSPGALAAGRQTGQSGSGISVPATSSRPPQAQAPGNTSGAGPSNAPGTLEAERQRRAREAAAAGRSSATDHETLPPQVQVSGNASGAGPSNAPGTLEAERQRRAQEAAAAGRSGATDHETQQPQVQASGNTPGAGPSNAPGTLEAERQGTEQTRDLLGKKRPRPDEEGESGSETPEPARKRTRPAASAGQAQPPQEQPADSLPGAGPRNAQETQRAQEAATATGSRATGNDGQTHQNRATGHNSVERSGNVQASDEALRQKDNQPIPLSGRKRSRPSDLEDNGSEIVAPPLKKGVLAPSRQSSSRIESANVPHEADGSNRGQPSARPPRSTPPAAQTRPTAQGPGSAQVFEGGNQNERARAPAELSAMEHRLTGLLDRTPQATPSTAQQPAETAPTRRLGQTPESRSPADTRRTPQTGDRDRDPGNRGSRS